MQDGTADPHSDEARTRLVDSIYEAVLRPDHYDVFMEDWAQHVEWATNRLDELRNSAGPPQETLEDPVLANHFGRAFAMLERIGRAKSDRSQQLIDARSAPMLAIRGGGALAISAEGRAIFGDKPGLSDIAAQLEPACASRFTTMFSRFRSAPAADMLAVLNLTDAKAAGSGVLVASTHRGDDNGIVLELRPLTIRWSPTVGQILIDTFHLTPRECDVVAAMTEQADLAAVAASSGRSLHTVRSQIKAVFQKTRTNSQADLLRLVAALVLFSPDADMARVVSKQDDWGELTMLVVPEGHEVPVHTLGPEGGTPVIFLHGMLDGLGPLTHLAGGLAKHGLRLIAPVRPNYGSARPDRQIKDVPLHFARDLAAVLEHFGVDRAVLLGHMGGGMHAFTFASQYGNRVAGIINISGAVPIRSISQFRSMTPRQRTVALTARYAPSLLPLVLRAGIAQIDGQDVAKFVSALYPPGTRDHRLIHDPAVARSLVDGYRFSAAQGERAFQTDSWHITRDWSDIVLRSDAPVRLLHGQYDPVVSISSVREFAAAHPRLALREVDCGQLIVYEHADMVLSEIRAVCRGVGVA